MSNQIQKEKILVIDDDPGLREICLRHLEKAGYHVQTAENAKLGLEHFESFKPDLVLLDLKMPDRSGQDVLADILSSKPEQPVVVVTAFNDARTAVELLKAGARDYLVKPFAKEELLHTTRQHLEINRLKEENISLQKSLEIERKTHHFLYQDPVMKQVMEQALKAARSDSPLIIRGPSGSGKKSLALHLHDKSLRSKSPVLHVDVRTIAESLVDSHLFGHVKGAFTGADTNRVGVLEQASSGTLVLSGLEEISDSIQTKLLRALETQSFRPLGANTEIQCDFRTISLFNENPEAHVQSGNLREDLYYRINVITLEIPPLEKRQEDIALLADHFAKNLSRELEPKFRQSLRERQWPGQIRELKNLIESRHNLQGTGKLSFELSETPSEKDMPTLDEIIRSHVKAVMDFHEGNKSAAAKTLGISRRSLYNHIESHESE